MRWSFLIVLLLSAVTLAAQESQLGADFRGEGDRFHESFTARASRELAVALKCSSPTIPLHIAAGGHLAPQNGFGAGMAFVAHYTPNENWRLSWDVDAIGSSNASWRAGACEDHSHATAEDYDHDNHDQVRRRSRSWPVRQYTVFNVYAQGIQLNRDLLLWRRSQHHAGGAVGICRGTGDCRWERNCARCGASSTSHFTERSTAASSTSITRPARATRPSARSTTISLLRAWRRSQGLRSSAKVSG